jgi:hypothetical protein
MKLILVLSFCVASMSMLAQQATPVKKAAVVKTAGNDACKANASIPHAITARICETMGNPDEVAKAAKQVGLETSISQTKDGRIITYFAKDPRTGKRVVVGRRLVIRN